MARHRRGAGAGPSPGAKPPGAKSQRQLRVGEEIRHALAQAIERGDMRDPDLRGVAITVTEVDASPDLRNATAFVTPLGGRDAERIVSAMRRAAPFFRVQVARALDLRHAPELRFELDRSFDNADRIESLLRSQDVRRDIAPDGQAAPRADDEPE